jgi:predicted phage tail protein
MTRTIYLNGKMGELFGSKWNLNAATVREAMHGIDCQREGKLKKYLIDCTEKGIHFTVQKGKEFLDYENLQMELGENDLIITPVPAGSLSKLGKIIVGIALMALGFYLGGVAGGLTGLAKAGTYFAAAAAMVAGGYLTNAGIAEYLAPKDPTQAAEGYLFEGPSNNAKQGIPVPLCYGQLIVGGAPMTFGFTGETNRPSSFTYAGKGYASTSTPPRSYDGVGRYCFVNGSVGDSGDDNRSQDKGSDVTWTYPFGDR